MKSSLILSPLLFTLCAGQVASAAAVFVNGSLTGPVANGGVPSGWTTFSFSPDTMDQNNNAGVGGLGGFGATPSASPDGGTWVGIADIPETGFLEMFGQMVAGFTLGETYVISWYQANFGYDPLGYVNPDKIGVTVDGVLVGHGSISPLAPGWTAESVQFVAASPSSEIRFGLGNERGRSYMSIDGISISAVPSPVPDLGSTAALLGVPVLGLALIRRKAKAV